MTKQHERDKARAMREQGYSITEICGALGVAKSSVSLWVRDIPISDEQRQFWKDRRAATAAQWNGSQTNRRKALEQRKQYQEEGRQKAREGDPLHMMGCMLYWGEGNKTRDMLRLANSDRFLLKNYMIFLRDALQVPDEKIVARVYCYLNNGLSPSEIGSYWLDLLGLTTHNLRKMQVNQPKSSEQKGRKLPYGVCEVTVYSTQLVMHVLGAIQEYGNFDEPSWLF